MHFVLESTFGALLAAEHVISRLSGQELGEAAGVSHDTLNNWEKGEGAPSVKQLTALCGKMGLDDTAKTRLYEAYAKAILDKITEENIPTKKALALAKMVSSKSQKSGLTALMQQAQVEAAITQEILDALKRVMKRAKSQQQL